MNWKYLDIFRREGVKGAYDALKANPSDHPMVPLDACKASGLNYSLFPDKGLVNFREEIAYKQKAPSLFCGYV
jgi:hypothetical protein